MLVELEGGLDRLRNLFIQQIQNLRRTLWRVEVPGVPDYLAKLAQEKEEGVQVEASNCNNGDISPEVIRNRDSSSADR